MLQENAGIDLSQPDFNPIPKDFSDLCRRNCIVTDEFGQPEFVFNFGGQLRLRTTRLTADLLCEKNSFVPLAVYHQGREMDQGHLQVNVKNGNIILIGFHECFRSLRGTAFKSLVPSHICMNDELDLMVKKDFFTKRAAKLAKIPGSGITYLGTAYRTH